MLNRLLLTALLAIALVPASAVAKGVTSAQVCGADACTTVDDDSLTPDLMNTGSPTDPPSHASGWYRVRLGIGDGERTFETFTINVVPKAGVIRSDQELGGAEWTEMTAAQQAVYGEATANLAPLPAAKLKGITNPPIRAADQAPPTAPATEDDGGGFPWALVIIASAIAALGVAMWALGLARRRRAQSDYARPA